MGSDFRGDMTKALNDATRNMKAWLGALQFSAYSTPPRIKAVRHTDKDGREVKSRISQSPDTWFEATRQQLEGSLKNAEATLANEWQKRRDPRHNGPDADEEFAHAFEEKIAAIARGVLDTERALKEGAVRPNPAAGRALSWVKNDLKNMIAIYTEHFHEMTMREGEGSLLSLRATIIDGTSRTL